MSRMLLEIHRAIAASGLSKSEVVRRTGKNSTSVRKSLRGTYTMTQGTLESFAEALGLEWQLVPKHISPTEPRSVGQITNAMEGGAK